MRSLLNNQEGRVINMKNYLFAPFKGGDEKIKAFNELKSSGQIKVITMTVAGNAATMTQGNGNLAASVSTSVVWDAVGETCSFIYSGAKWVVIGNQGATIS